MWIIPFLGHYCQFAVNLPTKCAAGTYMPWGVAPNGSLVGPGQPAKRQFSCLDCPGGYMCGEATIYPGKCGVGLYSKPGKKKCEVCPPAYYCDNTTTSYAAMLSSKRCPAGYYCAGGLKSVSEATACSVGHYCPEGKCPSVAKSSWFTSLYLNIFDNFFFPFGKKKFLKSVEFA
jgi:hypothetical protein